MLPPIPAPAADSTANAAAPMRPGDATLRQGWQVVAAAILAHFASVATVLSSFGVLIEPVARDFGVGVAVIGLGNGLLMSVSALCSAWIGPRLDRVSIRGVMMTGGVLMFAGLLGLSRTETLWQAGLLFAGVIGIGFTLLGALPSATLLAKWFHSRRGRALGLSTTGTTLATLAMPPLASWLVVSIGWRSTLAWFAWGGLLLLPLLFHWARNPPAEPGSAAGTGSEPQSTPATASPYTNRQLLGMRDFWVVAGIFGMAFSSGTVMMIYLIPYGIELGIAPAWAGWLLTLRSSFGLVGRVTAGWLADHMSLRPLLLGVVAVQASLWLVMIGKPDGMTLLFTVMGIGLTGAFFPLSNAATANVFGAEAFGQVTGLLNLVRLPLSLVTIPLAGYLRDVSGSYVLTFQVFLAGFVVTAVLSLLLREPKRGAPLAAPSP